MMLYGGITEPWKEVHGCGMKSKKCEQLWRGEKWKPPPQHVIANDPQGATIFADHNALYLPIESSSVPGQMGGPPDHVRFQTKAIMMQI
jgi:hypothetical protein